MCIDRSNVIDWEFSRRVIFLSNVTKDIYYIIYIIFRYIINICALDIIKNVLLFEKLINFNRIQFFILNAL